MNDVLNGDISVLFPSSVDVGRDGDIHGGTCETFFFFKVLNTVYIYIDIWKHSDVS